MEEYLQHLDILSHQELTDPGLLLLESQFLDLCSSYMLQILQFTLSQLTMLANCLWGTWNMESTRGSPPGIFLLLQTPTKNVFPWMVYTDKDFVEASKISQDLTW